MGLEKEVGISAETVTTIEAGEKKPKSLGWGSLALGIPVRGGHAWEFLGHRSPFTQGWGWSRGAEGRQQAPGCFHSKAAEGLTGLQTLKPLNTHCWGWRSGSGGCNLHREREQGRGGRVMSRREEWRGGCGVC